MNEQTHTWPELAAVLYDRRTGRDAEVTDAVDTIEIGVPSGTGSNATPWGPSPA